MPNSDPRDRFVCPYITQMIDSFSCTFLCQRLNLLQFYLKNAPHIHVSHFVLSSFSDALVTCVKEPSNVTFITTIVKQRVRTTGLEHQG